MFLRSSFSALLIGAISILSSSFPVAAAEPDVMIRLRPHCPEAFFGTATSGATAPCREFAEADFETLVLYGVKAGDVVDVDVVLSNPSQQPIQSIQSWLEYDQHILEGQEARIADTFPLIAPGEQTFSTDKGVVKLGASNVSGGMRDTEITFARVTFRALASATEPVRIRFHEFSLLGQEGKTKVLVVEDGRTVNILKTRPKNLLLSFGAAPASPVSPTPSPSPSVPTPATTTRSLLPDDGFTSMQPTGLRAATDGDQASLLWSPLTDARVIGYNIYYGTVTGRYIQRRTVASEVTSVTIRGLPMGKRYYFAITAYDALERETEFSYEVAVVIGDPGSSTAPWDPSIFRRDAEFPESTAPRQRGDDLRGTVIGREKGRVPGASGMPVLAFVTLAGISTASAVFWRRFSSRSV